MKKSYHLPIIIIVQFILICVGFNKIVFEGDKYMVSHGSDGLKNFYTSIYYIQQPIDDWKDIFEFEGMSYPQSDNVFFTDNTPLISIPLRVINDFFPLSAGAIVHIYQLFFVFLILISSVVLYYILSRFMKNDTLLILSSICLPLLEPQLLRLGHGLLNLSTGLPTLIAILLILRVLESKSGNIPNVKNLIFLFLLPVVSGLAHIYHVPILGVFIGFAFLMYIIFNRENLLRKRIYTSGFAVGSFILGSGIFYVFLKTIDRLSADRLSDPQGYNFAPWRLDVNDLFRSADFLDIQSLLNVETAQSYESYSYIGSWAVIALLVIFVTVIVLMIRGDLRHHYKAIFGSKSVGKYLIYIMCAACFGIILAAGNQININFLNISFDNIFSPFYWLNEKVHLIRQFRTISRFMFPVFFTLNITLLFILSQLLKKANLRLSKPIMLGFTILVFIINTISTLEHTNNKFSRTAYFTNTQNSDYTLKLTQGINMNSYDAILSLPAYYTGTGLYDYSIDPYDKWWARLLMDISVKYHIPVFNRNMSRGAVSPQIEFVDFLNSGGQGPLRSKLKGESILIIHLEESYNNTPPNKREPAYSAYFESNNLIDSLKKELILLKQLDKIKLYEWNVINQPEDK